MKVIRYRGGLVTFSIPDNWIEEYEPDGGGTFYENAPDSGTFRLNVITAKSSIEIDQNSASQVLRQLKATKAETIRNLLNGNALSTWVDETSERGIALTIYWWHVANPIEPFHIRIANFSYTVTTSQRNSTATKDIVELLTQSIEGAIFHPTLN